MPLNPPPLENRQQLRDDFIGNLVSVTGDTRRIWLPKPTDTTTSVDESRVGATVTHSATIQGRLSALGLGYAVSLNGTTEYSSIPDAADLSFGNSTAGTDQAFSLLWLGTVNDTANVRELISKWNAANYEWTLLVTAADKLDFYVYDLSVNKFAHRLSDAVITQGSPMLFGATYSAATGGATAGNDMTLYANGVVIASTATNDAGYVAMEPLGANVEIGTETNHTLSFLPGSVALALIAQKNMTASDHWAAWKLCKGYFGL